MRTLGFCVSSILLLTLGCRSKTDAKPGAPPASAALAASASAPVRLPPPPRKNWPMPSGPILAIVASQGVGPIRIGATVATIERHMALPCDVKTEEVCRYIARGVEFWLEQGVTKRIHVHRAGRPAGKDKTGKDQEYGFFHGAIPPDLQLGMIPAAIQEHLGPPKNIVKKDATGEVNNAEIHEYDGMRVEYDRIANGNLVMGGIIIEKPQKADAAPAASGK